jgi:hypothetical protein
VLDLFVLIMVTCLLAVHLRMIMRNMTTIESFEEQHMRYAMHDRRAPAPRHTITAVPNPNAYSLSETNSSSSSSPIIAAAATTLPTPTASSPNSSSPSSSSSLSTPVHRYDLGTWRNTCDVLGSQPLLWFLPIGGATRGDGHHFVTRAELGLPM